MTGRCLYSFGFLLSFLWYAAWPRLPAGRQTVSFCCLRFSSCPLVVLVLSFFQLGAAASPSPVLVLLLYSFCALLALSLSFSCPPLFLLLFSRLQKEAGHSVRPRRQALSALLLQSLVTILSALSSSFYSIAFLLSFFRCSLAAAASLSPVIQYSSRRRLVFLLPLFSSGSPLGVLPSCCPCPVTACPSSVFLVCSCCFPSLILLSSVVLPMPSSGLSVVLLLSCCLRCFRAGAAAAHLHNNNSCRLSCLGLCRYIFGWFLCS